MVACKKARFERALYGADQATENFSLDSLAHQQIRQQQKVAASEIADLNRLCHCWLSKSCLAPSDEAPTLRYPAGGADMGRERRSRPFLRTVHAILPHTGLQSVVSSSGLARQHSGFCHREQPQCSEVGIWPAVVIGMTFPKSRALFLFAQDRP